MFNYEEVPHDFGHCAIESCSHGDTCLRRIAYNHAPSNHVFLKLLSPRVVKVASGKCKYYCSNEKLRYAKGFMGTLGALPVRFSGTFRNRLIGSWGIRKYYQRRKGEILIDPTEQLELIALAKKLGVHLDEYFDGYVETYNWNH
jgi:hypothetical protein